MRKVLCLIAFAVLGFAVISCGDSEKKTGTVLSIDFQVENKLTDKIKKKISEGKYDLNETDKEGYNFFTQNISNLSIPDFNYLIDAGMKFDKADNNLNYPIFIYLNSGKTNKEFITAQLHNLSDLKIRDRNGNNLMQYPWMIENGFFYTLYKGGAFEEKKNSDGISVYTSLVKADRNDILKFLFVEKKAALNIAEDEFKTVYDYLNTKDKSLASVFKKMFNDRSVMNSPVDYTRPQVRRPADRMTDYKMKIMCPIEGVSLNHTGKEEQTMVYALCDIVLDDGTKIPAGKNIFIYEIIPDRFVVEDDYVCHVYTAGSSDRSYFEITDRYVSGHISGDKKELTLLSTGAHSWLNNPPETAPESFDDYNFNDFYNGDYAEPVETALLINGKIFDINIELQDVKGYDFEFEYGWANSLNIIRLSEHDPFPFTSFWVLDNLTTTYLGSQSLRRRHSYQTEFICKKVKEDRAFPMTISLVKVNTEEESVETTSWTSDYPYDYRSCPPVEYEYYPFYWYGE